MKHNIEALLMQSCNNEIILSISGDKHIPTSLFSNWCVLYRNPAALLERRQNKGKLVLLNRLKCRLATWAAALPLCLCFYQTVGKHNLQTSYDIAGMSVFSMNLKDFVSFSVSDVYHSPASVCPLCVWMVLCDPLRWEAALCSFRYYL